MKQFLFSALFAATVLLGQQQATKAPTAEAKKELTVGISKKPSKDLAEKMTAMASKLGGCFRKHGSLKTTTSAVGRLRSSTDGTSC